MTSNDALTAYGQYHKALALAFAGDFVGAEAILAGDEEGALHLNRSSIVAHAEILAQIDREADAIKVIDDALAGGVPGRAAARPARRGSPPARRFAFDEVTKARDGAADAFLTLADALNTADSQRVGAVARPDRRAHPPRPASRRNLLAAEILEDEDQYALATEALADVPDELALVRHRPDPPGEHPAGGRRPRRRHRHPDGARRQPPRPDRGAERRSATRFGMAERYPEAVAAYGAAIALVPEPMPVHWAALLHPRHRQRARRQLAGRRGATSARR